MSRFQEFRNDHPEGGLCITEIVPERVQLDKEEKVVIIFNNPLPPKGPFVVDFVSRTNKAIQVSARRLNSYTLKFTSPVFREADTVQAYVYHGIQRNLLGNHSFEFVSSDETFYKLLHSTLDPVAFMCDALGISPASIHGLDVALAGTFKANTPEGFNLLGVHVHNEITGTANSQYPTLLHFAAAFGLGRLMRTLEHCPGALEACSIKNCNGHRPYNIADEMGFSSLGDELRAFQDKGDVSVYIDTSGNDDDIYMPMEREDGTYYYVQVNREDAWSKPRYVNMKNQEAFCPVNVSGSGPDEIYENTLDTTNEVEGFYEDMGQQNHPEEDPYMQMAAEEISSDSEAYYVDMAKGSYHLKETGKAQNYFYDRPTSNQPVHPDVNFYRSASSAAEIRAKELQRQARSPPPPGTIYEKDTLKRISSVDQKLQNIVRADSISSRSSSSSNTSGISTGSGSTAEDDNEPILMSHAQLIEQIKKTSIKHRNQQEDDAPPPPPRPDYYDDISDLSGRTSETEYDAWSDSQPVPPPSVPRRKSELTGSTGYPAVSKYGQPRQARNKTAAVDGRDLREARNREPQPPPPPASPRRPSEPKVMDPKYRPPAPLPEPQAPKPVPKPRTLKRQ